MAQKGEYGIGECSAHGEYSKDAVDSACPTCEELLALTEEELDELVHDSKGAEAAAINNAGREAQLEYLGLSSSLSDDGVADNWYLVTGRVIGDDEDSMVVMQAGSEDEATRIFEKEMLKTTQGAEARGEGLEAIIYNYVVRCGPNKPDIRSI